MKGKSHDDRLQPIAYQITRAFVKSAALILLFYGLVFHFSVLNTENHSSSHRLELVAPHHFEHYRRGEQGAIRIDPLLVIYDDYQQLPVALQRRILPEWTGKQFFYFEDESEFGVVAQRLTVATGEIIAYAVENTGAAEWDDMDYILFGTILLSSGLLIFLGAAVMNARTARRIGEPFCELAQQLSEDDLSGFATLRVGGKPSRELSQVLTALNDYRMRIAASIEREQSFTRYVSHELRTPMTVIRGSLSLLRRQQLEKVDRQAQRIDKAINDMEELTTTFLLLARNDEVAPREISLDRALLAGYIGELAAQAEGNRCRLSLEAAGTLSLAAHPVLLGVAIKNLLINAIHCTLDGEIHVRLSDEALTIVDSGCGLDDKARGYEGFGVGLLLVGDICEKYGWRFSLANNPDRGCTALLEFRATASGGGSPDAAPAG